MIGPDHPDFENLPRKEQALIYSAFNWTQKAIAEELEVSLNTVKRWLNPEFEQATREAIQAYQKSEKGRAWKREYDAKRKAARPPEPPRQYTQLEARTKRRDYHRDYMRQRRMKARMGQIAHEISRQIQNP